MKRETRQIQVGILGRDELSLQLTTERDLIVGFELKACGCMQFLQQVQLLKQQLQGTIFDLKLPLANDHGSILIREVILKVQGQWKYPYQQEELCHCRLVSTRMVDSVIVAGTFTPELIAKETLAGTGCSSCRNDTQDIIDYRLGKKS